MKASTPCTWRAANASFLSSSASSSTDDVSGSTARSDRARVRPCSAAKWVCTVRTRLAFSHRCCSMCALWLAQSAMHSCRYFSLRHGLTNPSVSVKAACTRPCTTAPRWAAKSMGWYSSDHRYSRALPWSGFRWCPPLFSVAHTRTMTSHASSTTGSACWYVMEGLNQPFLTDRLSQMAHRSFLSSSFSSSSVVVRASSRKDDGWAVRGGMAASLFSGALVRCLSGCAFSLQNRSNQARIFWRSTGSACSATCATSSGVVVSDLALARMVKLSSVS
mmetsp:Transcript_52464/g.131965  ORF Transcript_52464/g.131965 Transcript_52464/m.131965 type:complete len:276 (-) Transcript_52464:459-1286(-)